MPESEPVTLRIPGIDVTSPVRQVGLADDNTIEAPRPGPHYDDAAWYRYSRTPGEAGTSIIEGHVDSAKGGPSVFYRLGDLHDGDKVYVHRRDGSVAVFVVDKVRRYRKERFPTRAVYENTREPSLRLVTCGGPFDRGSGHYRDNVIAFAHLAAASASPRP